MLNVLSGSDGGRVFVSLCYMTEQEEPLLRLRQQSHGLALPITFDADLLHLYAMPELPPVLTADMRRW